DAIMAREEVGSTGIHGGVAIPHAHFKSVKDIRGAFGRSAHPVDFRAVDGEATYLFFLVVAPPSKNEAYLQALNKISTAIRGAHFIKFLRAAKTAKEIEETLREAEEMPTGLVR
ncbi:MAG: PTS sugar transporter subunit IIA, partial [Planctomycetes bacterium]|nr:PTS sugar transporter subunit IIA [Planctomycetota bacterium]